MTTGQGNQFLVLLYCFRVHYTRNNDAHQNGSRQYKVKAVFKDRQRWPRYVHTFILVPLHLALAIIIVGVMIMDHGYEHSPTPSTASCCNETVLGPRVSTYGVGNESQ